MCCASKDGPMAGATKPWSAAALDPSPPSWSSNPLNVWFPCGAICNGYSANKNVRSFLWFYLLLIVLPRYYGRGYELISSFWVLLFSLCLGPFEKIMLNVLSIYHEEVSNANYISVKIWKLLNCIVGWLMDGAHQRWTPIRCYILIQIL
jgi:hypothetical protein